MVRRRNTQRPASPRRVSAPSTPRSPWPHIEELIECDGNISIGHIAPIQCAAVASDEHNMLAALARRKGETFTELLDRLDAAVAKAVDGDEFTDEINPK